MRVVSKSIKETGKFVFEGSVLSYRWNEDLRHYPFFPTAVLTVLDIYSRRDM